MMTDLASDNDLKLRVIVGNKYGVRLPKHAQMHAEENVQIKLKKKFFMMRATLTVSSRPLLPPRQFSLQD